MIGSINLIEVARQILGPPNKALSSAREARWGTKGSLRIIIGEDRWTDFERRESGDAIALVMREHCCGFREALDILGLEPESRPAPADRPTRPERQDVGAWRRAKQRDARAIWDASQPVADTPAEAYLRGRGLTLSGSLVRGVLRYHPACPYGLGERPALIALFRDMRTSEPVAIQRIGLTRDGGRARGSDGNKLPKLSLGPIASAAIMLTGPWTDTPYLGFCEGPETALALCNAGERSVWAVGGTSGLHALPLLFDRYPLSAVIFADADQPGQDAARVAAARYADAGRDALIISPAVDGLDFADLAA